jgi:membrane dipeptidase
MVQAHGPVSPQATLDMHLDQYDYLRKLIGSDHIGLGPDFVWGWGETIN